MKPNWKIRAKAEELMARKYGERAYQTMHNWPEVRNRLTGVLYGRYAQRALLRAMIIPAVTVAVAFQIVTWLVTR